MPTRTTDSHLASVATPGFQPQLLAAAGPVSLHVAGPDHLVLVVDAWRCDPAAWAYVSRRIPPDWVCWATEGDDQREYQHFGPGDKGDI